MRLSSRTINGSRHAVFRRAPIARTRARQEDPLVRVLYRPAESVTTYDSVDLELLWKVLTRFVPAKMLANVTGMRAYV